MKRERILLAIVSLFVLLVSGAGLAQESGSTATAAPAVSAPAEQAPAPAVPAEAPAAPVKEQMPTKVVKLHEVKSGEDLHLISAYYYGDARQWKKIWDLNKKDIRNPNRIEIGQIIKVEVEPGWQPKFNMDQYLSQRGLAGTVKKPVSNKKTTYVREREEVHGAATPRLLEEDQGQNAPSNQDSGTSSDQNAAVKKAPN
jgi:hypothetical protein